MCINGEIITVRKKGAEFSQTIKTNCGKCVDCITARVNAWAYRCYSHYLASDNCYFVTLTLNDENITDAPDKKDIQLFHKRLRAFCAYHYPNWNKKLKYFLVSEYGYQTERLHYHALYFNLPFDLKTHSYRWISNKLSDVWGKGFTYVKPFAFEQIYYCMKYLHKDKELGNIRMNSTDLGNISKEMINYINTTSNFENIKVKMGKRVIPMPRYFRKKFMTDEQKQAFCDYYVEKAKKDSKKFGSNKKLHNFEIRNKKWLQQ